MKILGIIGTESTKKNKWNGEIIRTGSVGVTGTDQSFVLLFEYLADIGHEVYLSFNQCIPNTNYKGVNYIDTSQLSKITNSIDILIIPSWYNEFLEYQYNNLKKLVIWCHYQGFLNEMILQFFKINYQHVKIYVNLLSQFVKKYIDKYCEYYLNYVDKIFTISNPLMFDQLSNSFNKISRSFIFFASFERGGQIAVDAFNLLPYSDKKLTVYSYDMGDINKSIHNINSVDKSTLFKILAHTEYFIYPLVLPKERNYLIHKDTDGCVIAEALLNEVIVLTYSVGAIYEKYNNHVIYLPFPPGITQEMLDIPDQQSVPQFYSEFVLDSIVATIDFLEKHPHIKTNIRQRGKEYVKNERSKENTLLSWTYNLEI